MEHDIAGGDYEPFWVGFPLTDIHKCIAPDVLHQLYQGVVKHLVNWVQLIIGEKELDERIQKLPLTSGVRHFTKGIASLSQLSGTERKHITRILLACLVRKVDPGGITACRAILHFIQLAQYPSHDQDTLGYMKQELDTWYKYRDYFIDKGVRSHFNIPKFHSLLHYIDSIRWIGATDNSNTEAFERLHIDFAKEGWCSSNKRDHFPQMITFLSRQEKKLSTLTLLHNAPGFLGTLKIFLNDCLPQEERLSKANAVNQSLPFFALDIWHSFRLTPIRILDDPEKIIIKSQPLSTSSSTSRQDTVLVLEKDQAQSTAVQGLRAARVRVIFCLPQKVLKRGFLVNAPSSWPQEPLAYVTWYTRFKSAPDKTTGMYYVEPAIASNGIPQGAIIPLANIRQNCMLVPSLQVWESSWTSDNILDKCSSFFVNNMQSKYTYQTIY
ncbi:hypothetical protein EV360DRAFT_53426 [Lentinula raphanica]|nr:hypothetical protein EV360DRAFT_53426 [Lentinula raphanica]